MTDRLVARRTPTSRPVALQINREKAAIELFDQTTEQSLGLLKWGGTVAVLDGPKLRVGADYFVVDDPKAATTFVLQVVHARDAAAKLRREASARIEQTSTPSRDQPRPTNPSPTTRPASEAHARFPIPIVALLVGGLALYGVARGFGGITFQWNCEEYAKKEAVEAYGQGYRAYDSYSFTGLVIGYCQPEYSDR